MSQKTTPYSIEDLKDVMKTLRSPSGCPWDKKQSPKSLTPYAIEEAYELEDAIYNKSQQDVKDELGDLLFQVIFQAQMADEVGNFNFDEVVHHLCSKLKKRHPHVFEKSKTLSTPDEVAKNWEEQKSKANSAEELFDFPKNLPSLLTAVKIGKKSRVMNFDWDSPQEVLQHVHSELKEVIEVMNDDDPTDLELEIGDLLFTIAQLARKLKIDPEKSLRLSNQKIIQRIKTAHELSGLDWESFCQLSTEQKDHWWEQAKKHLVNNSF